MIRNGDRCGLLKRLLIHMIDNNHRDGSLPPKIIQADDSWRSGCKPDPNAPKPFTNIQTLRVRTSRRAPLLTPRLPAAYRFSKQSIQADAEGRRQRSSADHVGSAFARTRHFGCDVPMRRLRGLRNSDQHIGCDIGSNLKCHCNQLRQGGAGFHLAAAGVEQAGHRARVRTSGLYAFCNYTFNANCFSAASKAGFRPRLWLQTRPGLSTRVQSPRNLRPSSNRLRRDRNNPMA